MSESKHTLAELQRLRAINATMLAALERAACSLGWLARDCPRLPDDLLSQVEAAIREAKDVPGPEVGASARLMSVAPDLLAACEALDRLDWCGGYEMTQHDELQRALDLARAALRKAKE